MCPGQPAPCSVPLALGTGPLPHPGPLLSLLCAASISAWRGHLCPDVRCLLSASVGQTVLGPMAKDHQGQVPGLSGFRV